MKLLKNLYLAILTATLFLSVLPTNATAATVASGTTELITWEISSTGTLTLSGYGAISNYSNVKPPWYYHASSIKRIVIESGITEIEDYAFNYCSYVTSISLPEGLTAIGNCAFSSTAYYKTESNWSNDVLYIGSYLIKADLSLSGNYTIESGTTFISSYAFSGCTELESVIFPETIKYIDSYAFYNCTSLNEVALNCNLAKIGDYAFKNCTGMSKLIIGGESPIIDTYAFYNCSNLDSVTILNKIYSIKEYAFWGCNNLSNVYISDLAAWCSTKFFNEYSNPLSYAKNLYIDGNTTSELTIPCTSISGYAFYNCDWIKSVIFPNGLYCAGKYAFYGCNEITSVLIANLENQTLILDSAFAYCDSLHYIALPESLITIGNEAFINCNNIEFVLYSGSTDQWESISFGLENTNLYSAFVHYNHVNYASKTNCLTEVDSCSSYGYYCSDCCCYFGFTEKSISTHSFSDGICAICGVSSNWSYTIKENATVVITNYTGTTTDIVIPDTIEGYSVTTIGENVFSCSKIQSITIPELTISIEKNAFQSCTQLQKVFYKSTEEAWSAVTIDVGNDSLINAEINYNFTGKVPGDFNGDFVVTDDDALYLLRHVLFSTKYPVSIDSDVNCDGITSDADAIYLLRYTLFPDLYPLYSRE